MEEQQLKIFECFPLLVPCDGTWTKYDGYVTVKGCDYRITLDVPEYPKATNIKITFSDKLLKFESSILAIDTKSLDLIGYLKNVYNVIHDNSEAPTKHYIDYKVLFFVLEQYKDLSNDESVYAIDISKDFTTINLKYLDEANLEHLLVIKVDITSDKNIFKIVSHNLPEIKNNGDIIKPSNKLRVLWEQFCATVKSLQPFYNAMDSIDTVCWVLDPKEPSKTDVSRRIVIANNVSIYITFDPWNINEKPQMQFLGPERLIKPFRENLTNNYNNWDPEYDVVQNILRLLDLPFFPMKPTEDEIVKEIVLHSDEECGICFALRFNNELPDIVCENEQCEIHYHSKCLYQWFLALTTTIRAFNVIRGECPNCKSIELELKCRLEGRHRDLSDLFLRISDYKDKYKRLN